MQIEIVIVLILIGTRINTFVVKVVSLVGCQLIWKVLNRADRLSLSDTDERAKDMPRSRMIIIGA
jgi:hypothetical protein